MKVKLSVSIDDSLYNMIKHRPNISRYIQEVLREHLAEEQKDNITKRVSQAMQKDDDFIRFVKATCDEYMEERRRGEWM